MSSGTMWLKMAGPAPNLGCSSYQSCKAIARPVSFEEPSSSDRDLQLTRSCHLWRVSSGYEQHSDLAHHRSPLRVLYLRFAGRFFRACISAIVYKTAATRDGTAVREKPSPVSKQEMLTDHWGREPGRRGLVGWNGRVGDGLQPIAGEIRLALPENETVRTARIQ